MKLDPSVYVLDSSKLQDYLTCPRQFFYRHVLGWRPSGAQFDLVFGEAIHAALEQLYTYGFGAPFGPDHTKKVQRLAYTAFLDVYRQSFGDETDDDHPAKNPYSAAEAIESYCAEYHNEFNKYKVLELEGNKCVEVSGFVPITADQKLFFRQDVILVERSTDRIFTLEHKTASRGGHTWQSQWALSLQVGAYTHALYSLFPRDQVWGARVNGIIFQKRSIGFERVPCEKTYQQMQVWHRMVRTWISLIVIDLNLIRGEASCNLPVQYAFPLNPTNCTKWNRLCPYHDFCTSWPNPLKMCDEVPLGMVQEFWDPQRRQKKEIPKDV